MGLLMSDKWVFAYGSLIWDPGFDYLERRRGALEGYQRSFCLYSTQYRGSVSRPGLTLGLVSGGRVEGVAFKVDGDRWSAVYNKLIEREQSTSCYREEIRPVVLDDGEAVPALVFVTDEECCDWAGQGDVQSQARRIARSKGSRGSNLSYLFELVQALGAAQIHDRYVEDLYKAARSLTPSAA